MALYESARPGPRSCLRALARATAQFWPHAKTLLTLPNGMANTIMIAEGREDSPLPQPVDLPYSPDRPLPPLGREDAKNFMVLMADGSARFVRKEVGEVILRSAITGAGKDSLGPEWRP